MELDTKRIGQKEKANKKWQQNEIYLYLVLCFAAAAEFSDYFWEVRDTFLQ